MNEVMAIAGSTWRAVLRMKVVYFLILCVWLLIASTWNYDVISLNRERTLMVDASLLLNQIAAVLAVISITFEIPRELKDGVASTLLTKSLGRTQYIFGKMIGVCVTGFVICILIALGAFGIYHFAFNEEITLSFVIAQLLLILSIVPMAAVAVLFSVILPEMLAPVVTLIAIWLSFSTYNISIPVLNGGVLMNLDLFNFKSHAVYEIAVPWSYVGLATLWGIAYAVFALMLASIIFRFRDIR